MAIEQLKYAQGALAALAHTVELRGMADWNLSSVNASATKTSLRMTKHEDRYRIEAEFDDDTYDRARAAVTSNRAHPGGVLDSCLSIELQNDHQNLRTFGPMTGGRNTPLSQASMTSFDSFGSWLIRWKNADPGLFFNDPTRMYPSSSMQGVCFAPSRAKCCDRSMGPAKTSSLLCLNCCVKSLWHAGQR